MSNKKILKLYILGHCLFYGGAALVGTGIAFISSSYPTLPDQIQIPLIVLACLIGLGALTGLGINITVVILTLIRQAKQNQTAWFVATLILLFVHGIGGILVWVYVIKQRNQPYPLPASIPASVHLKQCSSCGTWQPVIGDGTFSVFLPIPSSLATGRHRVNASEATTRRSVSLSFVVTQSVTTNPTPVTASAATVTLTPASKNVNTTLTISGVTGTPNAQQVQARQVSATTQTYSKTVNATGQSTIPGMSSSGTITISNYTNASLTINTGMSYPCTGTNLIDSWPPCSPQTASLTLVVDQSITLAPYPNPNNTVSGIPAHIQQIGAISNFGLYCSGYYCFSYDGMGIRIHNDSTFTGGTDPQSYTYVQQSDIDNAATSLASANKPDATQMLQGQVQANERLADTPQCTKNVSSDHQAGDRVNSVTVSVSFVCSGETYDYDGALKLARQMLGKQEADKLGAGYQLVGQIISALNSATSDTQTVTIVVAVKGVWAYQIAADWQPIWARVMAGENVQDAQVLLLSQQGIAKATIQLSDPTISLLPANWHAITFVVQTVSGF